MSPERLKLAAVTMILALEQRPAFGLFEVLLKRRALKLRVGVVL
jgi:hypothetical protein